MRRQLNQVVNSTFGEHPPAARRAVSPRGEIGREDEMSRTTRSRSVGRSVGCRYIVRYYVNHYAQAAHLNYITSGCTFVGQAPVSTKPKH